MGRLTRQHNIIVCSACTNAIDTPASTTVITQTVTEWRIDASASFSNIGAGDGVSRIVRQVVTWINDGILLIEPLGIIFPWTMNKNVIFIQENAFEYIVRKITTMLALPQWVRYD